MLMIVVCGDYCGSICRERVWKLGRASLEAHCVQLISEIWIEWCNIYCIIIVPILTI